MATAPIRAAIGRASFSHFMMDTGYRPSAVRSAAAVTPLALEPAALCISREAGLCSRALSTPQPPSRAFRAVALLNYSEVP